MSDCLSTSQKNYSQVDMLHKFLNVHKLKPFSKRAPVPPNQAPAQSESGNSVLKVVHAGGNVDSYYMAIPAAKILEKYPSSFLLARPEVFRRPWDSIVKPDAILTPGEKVFLVPHRTVRKLRRRIRKPRKDFSQNKQHVTFAGLDVKHKPEKTPSKTEQDSSEQSSSLKAVGGRRRIRIVTWEPTLAAITETHGNDVLK